MHLRWAALLLLLMAPPLSGAAQEAIPVPVGSLVRVASPVYSGVATVVSSGADSLRLVVEGLSAPVSVPVAGVARLERRRSADALERAARGAMWGGGVMGALSLVMVASLGPSGISDTGPEGPPPPAAYVLMGAASGALWGGVIGLAIPQHRWEPVPLPARVGLSPAGRAGVSITGAIAF